MATSGTRAKRVTSKMQASTAFVPETLTRKGFKIRGLGPLPGGFDPMKATPRQLAAYRLPLRPDAKKEPRLRALWDTTMSRTKLWITPEFEHRENITHGPARGAKGKASGARAASPAVANATSTNWSGATVFSPAGKPYGFVGGQWTVPSPNSTADGAYYASEWVGIDGWNSSDVLQAGTETQITKLFFITIKQVYAWWEWFPAGEVKISNLPVSAGDVMYCLICADTATHATVYFTNQSQGVGTRFEITPPSGTRLTGNVAEWIVERPTVGGSVAESDRLRRLLLRRVHRRRQRPHRQPLRREPRHDDRQRQRDAVGAHEGKRQRRQAELAQVELSARSDTPCCSARE